MVIVLLGTPLSVPFAVTFVIILAFLLFFILSFFPCFIVFLVCNYSLWSVYTQKQGIDGPLTQE